MPDPLPPDNPLEPSFLALLRSFVVGRDHAQKEVELAANSYLELLRTYLLGARDTWRAAAVTAPAAVRSFLKGLPLLGVKGTVKRLRLPQKPHGVESLLTRDPHLAQTALEVSAAYRHRGVAFARSSSLAMTARVQETIGKMMEEGVPFRDGGEVIERMTGWTKGYATTAYRTTAMASYTAARIETQQRPFISSIFPGFEVIGSHDSDTRRGRPVDRGENHLAALGMVAPTNHAIWQTHTPPFGFNCRHSIRSISIMEARRAGWLDANGHLRFIRPEDRADKQHSIPLAEFSPKQGFGGKPRSGT